MKKFIFLIFIILMFSFSITPCFAKQYTIDEIITNGTIGYIDDSHYDNAFNLITYLDYLKNDENHHSCSTFNSRYCSILEYYNKFLESYAEVGSSYNFYLVSDLSSNKYNTYWILTDSEMYYSVGYYAGDRLFINSSDVRVFRFSGSFEYHGDIIPWNYSGYNEDDSGAYNIPGTSVSNILLSSVDVYDEDGNLIFNKNMNIEEPEPEGGDGLVIDTLKDFLRWAILPSDDFFSAWKDEQLNKIDELDNVLTYPFALLVRFGDTVFSLDEEEDPKICWVDVEFSVKNEKYHLLDKGCFHFNSILETEKLNELYGIYLLFVKFVFISMFISLCIKKWNSIFNKGG